MTTSRCGFPGHSSIPGLETDDDVELRVVGDGIVIESISPARAGWAEAAHELRERGGDRLLDEPTRTRFDSEEWNWGWRGRGCRS